MRHNAGGISSWARSFIAFFGLIETSSYFSCDSILYRRGLSITAIIKASAPALSPKTWYGMPAYANKDGKVVCFFQSAQKFKTRYATFGFSDAANLDEGAMWPTTFALMKLTAAEEAKIAALVKKAVS